MTMMRFGGAVSRSVRWCIGMALALCQAAEAASPPVTRQAAAANAAFLAYAPPPPSGVRALCLVDTGVDAIPDTAPGLVSATALDGGSGGDADPQRHGTINAAVAGGVGHGVLGAWPQLKVVSIRATDSPPAGQVPTFRYNDYINGVNQCSQPIAGLKIAVIALPLSSVILPTPDQVEEFDDAIAHATSRGTAILAAAGNEPGPVHLPGSQPGVVAVGAGDTVGGGVCPFSASTGVVLFAPGCTIDQITALGEPFCCGNGTSQAAAFAAGVLAALRSYAPGLTPEQATRLLVSTTRGGHLDATAAFRAAGLDAIVDAGNAAIPRPASAPAPAAGPVATPARLPRPRVRRATWRRGELRVVLRTRPRGAVLHARVSFEHRRAMFLRAARSSLRARTPPPARVRLHFTRGAASSAKVAVRVTRLRG